MNHGKGYPSLGYWSSKLFSLPPIWRPLLCLSLVSAAQPCSESQSMCLQLLNTLSTTAPRAGNAIRGSARPAGSASLLSGRSRQPPIFLFVLSYPSVVYRVTILHLSCSEHFQCVSSRRLITFLPSVFDDTAVAAIKLVGHYIWTVQMFCLFVRVDKCESWYATNLPFIIVRQVGEPVLNVF